MILEKWEELTIWAEIPISPTFWKLNALNVVVDWRLSTLLFPSWVAETGVKSASKGNKLNNAKVASIDRAIFGYVSIWIRSESVADRGL